ncbi:hypothetical protein C8R46DRAFT_1353370 [Mycena filopes]|nr:hypothetical protein C8R46DRAFT_1353370 [Mycena filopes]
MDYKHWNKTPFPSEAYATEENFIPPFDVDWRRFMGISGLQSTKPGVPPMSVIALHTYFGIQGCIIPIAYLPESDDVPVYVFTIAGPCDGAGKKQFYLMQGSRADNSSLMRYKERFASVQDFFENAGRAGVERLSAAEGGKEAVEEILDEFDLW